MDPRKNAGHTRGGHEQKTPPKSNPTGFGVFGLRPELMRAINNLDWITPTPVQQKAIPPVLEGHDLIALAQTGTGKTGAFVLPLLEMLSDMPRARPLKPYCLILVPTRELVQQIDSQVKALGRDLRVNGMTIFGGVSERPQIAQLKKGVELVAATPGRLLDLMGRGMIKLDKIEFCVLDESDRMFDMGFINDLKRILGAMPVARQTLLFSATMPPEIQRLAQEFLHHPREVRLQINKPPAELSHEVWELGSTQKNMALELLLQRDYESVLVFTRTKHRANSVARRLENGGESVAILHGNRSQNQRDLALARFKQGRARVMVATDVASRGLDIVGIGLVVNYDTPSDPDDYVHRVGRTARAKRKGCAISFLAPGEGKNLRNIEQLLKMRITRRSEPLRSADFNRQTETNESQATGEANANSSQNDGMHQPDSRNKSRHRRSEQRRSEPMSAQEPRSRSQRSPDGSRDSRGKQESREGQPTKRAGTGSSRSGRPTRQKSRSGNQQPTKGRSRGRR